MLYNFVALKPKDIDVLTAARTELSDHVDMENHVAAIYEYALDLAVAVGEFGTHPCYKLLQSLGTVCGVRSVLNIW